MIPVNKYVVDLSLSSDKTKATFFYRIIMQCSKSLCETIIKYATWRLEKICELDKRESVFDILKIDAQINKICSYTLQPDEKL